MCEAHKIVNTTDDAWKVQDTREGHPHGWIQWKGTNVCMDVHCKCGFMSHFDGWFAYHMKCPACGTVYMLNGHIEFIELREEPKHCVVVGEADEDELDEWREEQGGENAAHA